MRYLYIALISCFLALNLPLANAQIITTIAGNGTGGYSGNGGQATNAELNQPRGVAIDNLGNLYVADCANALVRKVSVNGIISTYVGNGIAGYSGDGGQATAAELNSPVGGLAIDISGNLFIADFYNNCIRKVNTLGIITTIAGNGTSGYSGDGGQATAAEISRPTFVAVDIKGNLYISDCNNNVIRKVNTSGIITTIVGNGPAGYSGDGGQATAAEIAGPQGISVDGLSNIYFADNQNSKIRKVNTAGVISTFAGIGIGPNGDGGQATASELEWPEGLTMDAAGNLYLADYGNNRIRIVNTSGIINTVAGKEQNGYSGDGGLATAAEINEPYGLAIDPAGNLYIGDLGNNRIRKVTNASLAGIEQFANINEQIMVYPNPSSGILNVELGMLNENTELKITDMLGNTVKQAVINNNKTAIDASDLSEGIYNINIHNKESITNKKVVIVK